ncbi:16S rRNA (adenine(1518)-N(6)/adenine(1519)-N(6))-dimethyltransferaseRsmA [soil metagenome]
MRAKKSLGQNFLRDSDVIDRIVQSLGPIDESAVVEIGPGRGALTEKLLEKAARVIAIEFDRDMIAILNERFGRCDNLTLINADALNIDYSPLVHSENCQDPAKLVANLPYNISTPILQSLAAQRVLFSDLVLMFQKEVVERITAPPGGRERGFLSVIVEEAFETEKLFDVPPSAFTPVPKVWNSVVRLAPKPFTMAAPAVFRKLVSSSFAQKRKTILNNLRSILKQPEEALAAAGIEGRRRAETLTLEEWRRLTDVVEPEINK